MYTLEFSFYIFFTDSIYSHTCLLQTQSWLDIESNRLGNSHYLSRLTILIPWTIFPILVKYEQIGAISLTYKKSLHVWFLPAPSKLVPMIAKGWCFSTSFLTITFCPLSCFHACFLEHSSMSSHLVLCTSIISYKTGASSLSPAFTFYFSFSSFFCCNILPFSLDVVSYVATPSSLYTFSLT